jgi:AraC-like DNA-binding protein
MSALFIDGSTLAASWRGENMGPSGAARYAPSSQVFGAGAARPVAQRLCLRTVLAGRETLQREHRSLRIDADHYIIQNGLAEAPRQGNAEGRPLVLVFSAAQIERALAGTELPLFHEHLRQKDDPVGAQLGTLEAALQEGGSADPQWLDAQFVALLQSMLRAEQDLERTAQRIDCVKPATRQELLRRVLLATDFILSHYELPLQLEDIAQAARLSRFHLLRLFRQVLGVTPHAYLLQQRLRAARRLLARREGDLSQIALNSGFGNRWSLFRRLQAEHGAGGQALRGAQSGACASPVLPRRPDPWHTPA